MTTTDDDAVTPDLPPVAPGLRLTTPDTVDHERTPFSVDGEVLWAVRPKAGQLMALVRSYNAGADEFEQVKVLEGFLDLCLEPETAAVLRDRMDDPDDGFDLEHVQALMEGLQTHWFARPTGRPSSSSGTRRRTGRGSTARARRTG